MFWLLPILVWKLVVDIPLQLSPSHWYFQKHVTLLNRYFFDGLLGVWTLQLGLTGCHSMIASVSWYHLVDYHPRKPKSCRYHDKQIYHKVIGAACPKGRKMSQLTQDWSIGPVIILHLWEFTPATWSAGFFHFNHSWLVFILCWFL